MDEIKEQVCKQLHIHSVNYAQFFNPPPNTLDWELCPAIALAICSSDSKMKIKGQALALSVQQIFLAGYIHCLVHDDKADCWQHHVLVGDYLLGLGFQTLINNDLSAYTKEFTNLVQTMSEGIVLRWSLRDTHVSLEEWKQILSKERASITALSGRIAAEISGFTRNQVMISEQIGYFIGMAWASWEESLGLNISRRYLNKAKRLIVKLDNEKSIKLLQELTERMSKTINFHGGIRESAHLGIVRESLMGL
ncbi:MAG: hypothetical protein GX434_07740 [Peptococcaceae bacterium]|nr:hypothetical protein [Peptococcaceae bacterium]